MPNDLPLRCQCGLVRGLARDVAPSNGNRVICYCDDCQAFPIALGRADDVLDEHGGTEIFQMVQARFEITSGIEHVQCLQLGPARLFRWYADCCNTPIGNTLTSAQVPLIGLIEAFMDQPEDGRSRDELLGPVQARVFGRFARDGVLPPGAHESAPLGVTLRMVGWLLAERLRGHNAPSPLFDRDGAPIATPRTEV